MEPVPVQRSPMEMDSASGVSLEYSLDGSSTAFTQDGSLLMGQNIADDASANKRPSLAVATAATTAKKEDDDQSALLSLQESSSTMVSVVPADEELFAVGWAKAIDPKSGNYYYFTLDRSKTVWENPLAGRTAGPVDAPGA